MVRLLQSSVLERLAEACGDTFAGQLPFLFTEVDIPKTEKNFFLAVHACICRSIVADLTTLLYRSEEHLEKRVRACVLAHDQLTADRHLPPADTPNLAPGELSGPPEESGVGELELRQVAKLPLVKAVVLLERQPIFVYKSSKGNWLLYVYYLASKNAHIESEEVKVECDSDRAHALLVSLLKYRVVPLMLVLDESTNHFNAIHLDDTSYFDWHKPDTVSMAARSAFVLETFNCAIPAHTLSRLEGWLVALQARVVDVPRGDDNLFAALVGIISAFVGAGRRNTSEQPRRHRRFQEARGRVLQQWPPHRSTRGRRAHA